MSEGDVALACCSLLVDELVRGGMEHACLSPGSRSTPIALALARDPRVRVHVHLDERGSAFFALGLAKATGRPVGVACTSGTAAANFLPAVVEASQSRTPLVLLTADRPPDVRGTGANQTIDQVELYGRYARSFADAPLPKPGDGARWRGLGVDAIARALREPQGPVHVNLPFREPLVPEGKRPDVDDQGPVGRELPRARRIATPSEADILRLRREIAGVERGAVVIGSMPSPPGDVLRLARTLSWPVIAEPTSQARTPGRALAAGQALLADRSFIAAHDPEVVIQAGATPTARATQAFVASADRAVVIDAHHLDPDPERRATWKLHADANATAMRALEDLEARTDPSPWLEEWRAADRIARHAMDDLIDAWDEPFEGRIARDLAAAIPPGGVLVVGSSMPIRDLDHYMATRDGIRILANRGASGIDGFVSTVLGVAAAGPPTFALMGDLTLLHDAGSLLWNCRRGIDAVIVVPNNDGGVVFSFLPQRDLPEHEELFATPHGLDIARLAETAGAGHERIERASELTPAVQRAAAAGGVRLVEVPSDRDRNVARHSQVSEAVAEALAGR